MCVGASRLDLQKKLVGFFCETLSSKVISQNQKNAVFQNFKIDISALSHHRILNILEPFKERVKIPLCRHILKAQNAYVTLKKPSAYFGLKSQRIFSQLPIKVYIVRDFEFWRKMG